VAVIVVGVLVWAVYQSQQPDAPATRPIETLPQGNPLIMLADEINVTCPRVIDLGTRLDSTRGGPGARFAYFFTLPRESAEGQTELAFVQRMRSIVAGQLAEKPETGTLKEFGVTLEYHYADARGGLLGVVLFRPDDY